jgi:hypothetical protein
MRQSERAARAQDAARTRFSHRALSTGRRSKPTNSAQLRNEQDDYRRRFGTRTERPAAIIVDVGGNYPDHTWTR